MSRFTNYTDELNEKVSKKEIDNALKNNNVVIGQEFEMKIPTDQINGDSDVKELYDKAEEQYHQWYKDIEKYEKERQEYYDETEEKREQFSDIEDAINAAEPYSDELDDSFDFQKDWIDGDAKSEWIHDSNIAEIYKHIRGRKGKPFSLKDVDTIKKLQDIVEELSSVRDELDDEIKYREGDGYYEELYQYIPYILSNEYSEYVEYMLDYGGTDITYEAKNLGKYMPEESEDLPIPPDLDDIGYGGVPDYEEVLNLDDAPFKKYEIGEYQEVSQAVGSGVWAIEPDNSLGDNGVEIKSPPMVAPIAIKNMDDMFDWMSSNDYYTDNDCGFHAHLSLKGVKDLSKVLNPVKLILFTDEEYIFHSFRSRMNNGYVKSIHNKLKSGSDISVNDIKQIIDKKKLMMKMGSEHFDAINFSSTDQGHVEFRYMGGANYHKKGKDVKKILGTFIHNFALACDKDYKYKEYQRKLTKVLNKLELYSKGIKARKFNVIITNIKEKGLTLPVKLLKAQKEYKKSVNVLKGIYKLKKKEHHLLSMNRYFTQSVNDELNKEVTSILKKAGFTDNELNYVKSGLGLS